MINPIRVVKDGAGVLFYLFGEAVWAVAVRMAEGPSEERYQK